MHLSSLLWLGTVKRSCVLVLLFLTACGGGGARDAHLGEAPAVHVEHAGLVILNPFLPRLFAMNDYTEGGRFKDRFHQERAVQLVRYLATGSSGDSSAPLSMAKVLCGLAPDDPITSWPVLSEKEESTAASLLQAVKNSWPALHNSSDRAFQEGFLSRNGVLHDRGDYWEVQVEQRAIDVLLRSLPFAISPIRLDWMPKPIKTQWQQ
jgi:hypothetical protein